MIAKFFAITSLILTLFFVASPGWALTPKETPVLLDNKEFFKPELALSSSNVSLVVLTVPVAGVID